MNQWQNYQNPMNAYYQSLLSQQTFPKFMPQQNQVPQVNSRFVTNIEEARAALIDPLSINIYLDTNNGKIYLKKLSNSGQSEFLCYSTDTETTAEQVDPIDDIKTRLVNIENILGEITHGKSVPSDSDVKQSATVSKPAAPVSYEPDDETESPSVSKGYGINIWQK